jgi:hypothetical protein
MRLVLLPPRKESARAPFIENWRRHYNTIRPHSSLGYRPPAPDAFTPARPAPQSGPAAPHATQRLPRRRDQRIFSSRPDRWCGIAGPDPRERWPSLLVAAAAESRLSFRHNGTRRLRQPAIAGSSSMVQGRRRAQGRMGKAPAAWKPGPPTSLGPRGRKSSREGSRHALIGTRTGVFCVLSHSPSCFVRIHADTIPPR